MTWKNLKNISVVRETNRSVFKSSFYWASYNLFPYFEFPNTRTFLTNFFFDPYCRTRHFNYNEFLNFLGSRKFLH
ncbi:hypothetical protein CWI38_0064p0020 [Hamiltosporidium tvaerminnensis]|uniref:Uncharacterized protein n=1 Tax=Hamiltosporidium tvaerminnensis TaxID=1176355 RepID=A0A4Q9M1A1_9MICR|nr:hypothetical protein CWI38_0064p0020 [Hamiltosporidium tvaerminnensis]